MTALTSVLVEDYVPVIKYNGFNTNQSITIGGSANLDMSASSGTFSPPTGGIAGTNATGATFAVSNTAVYTGTGVVTVAASGLTSGTALLVSGSGAAMTSGGTLLQVSGGANTTGRLIQLSTTGVYTGTAGLISLSANNLTTGKMLVLNGSAGNITTGFYLAANDSALDVFTIGANGHVTFKQTTAPTIVVTTQAGITAAAVTAGSSDTAGTITTTGTSTGATQLTVTFDKTYTAAPKTVSLTPANAAAAMPNTGYYVDNITATTFRITVAAGGTYAATPSWYYQVIA